MIFQLLVAISVVACIYWLWMRYHKLWKYMSKLPGPPAYPLVGNILGLGFTYEDYYMNMRRWIIDHNHQPICVWAGPVPFLFISDPKYMEIILSSTNLTHKDEMYRFMTDWLGEGLLTANGSHWLKHRKMITPSFHFQILQDFLHIMNETADRFLKLLDEHAKPKSEMFDFQAFISRYTIDVICESAMGIRVNTIESDNSKIASSIASICRIMQQRIFGLFKRSNLLFYLTPDFYEQRKSLRILRHEFSKIIEDRRQILKERNIELAKANGKHSKMAFLDNLLTAEVDGRPLTFGEIFEEVSTFMFEGHDTTASAFTFATFCLSRHPAVQELAFAEQYALFGNDTKTSPTYQQLQEMKYLEHVIKESLRLFPSVPFIGRTMKEDTIIGDYMVPRGVTALLCIGGVGTDAKNYEDPYAFRPERFEAIERQGASAYDYVPFSAGPRNCIGQKFALMELKVTISKILRNYHILPAVDGLPAGIHDPGNRKDIPTNPYDPRLAVFLTLKSVNGVYIRLRKRSYD